MIAFYAMGGGLGHLTRVRAFIHTYQIPKPVKVITANRSVFKFFTKEEVIFIKAEAATTRDKLSEKIHTAVVDFTFDHLFIDTFPCGILGELDNGLIQYHQKHYLARRLIWKNYEYNGSKVEDFNHVYRFEPLEAEHQEFINSRSKMIIDARLDFFTARSKKKSSVDMDSLTQPIWLIVHTTHQAELHMLVDHAKDIASIEQIEPKLVILSDVKIISPDSGVLLHDENPMDWYPKAARIFTAAGFNTWYQLAPWRNKQTALPFKRKFDDQFWRVKSGS